MKFYCRLTKTSGRSLKKLFWICWLDGNILQILKDHVIITQIQHVAWPFINQVVHECWPHLCRRLYPDMAFFQRPTEYPCQLILDPQNDYETLRRRVEQTTLKAQTVNRNRSGVTNVSRHECVWLLQEFLVSGPTTYFTSNSPFLASVKLNHVVRLPTLNYARTNTSDEIPTQMKNHDVSWVYNVSKWITVFFFFNSTFTNLALNILAFLCDFWSVALFYSPLNLVVTGQLSWKGLESVSIKWIRGSAQWQRSSLGGGGADTLHLRQAQPRHRLRAGHERDCRANLLHLCHRPEQRLERSVTPGWRI